MAVITDLKTQRLIASFRPDTLNSYAALRAGFPKMTDDEFITHLIWIGVPRAVDLGLAARALKEMGV